MHVSPFKNGRDVCVYFPRVGRDERLLYILWSLTDEMHRDSLRFTSVTQNADGERIDTMTNVLVSSHIPFLRQKQLFLNGTQRFKLLFHTSICWKIKLSQSAQVFKQCLGYSSLKKKNAPQVLMGWFRIINLYPALHYNNRSLIHLLHISSIHIKLPCIRDFTVSINFFLLKCRTLNMAFGYHTYLCNCNMILFVMEKITFHNLCVPLSAMCLFVYMLVEEKSSLAWLHYILMKTSDHWLQLLQVSVWGEYLNLWFILHNTPFYQLCF